MKYTLQTLKYVVKNFIFLVPFVIVPAFLFALSIDEVALEALLRAFFTGDFASVEFGLIFRSVSFLGFTSGWTVLSGLGGLATLILGVSLMMAFTERHMRIGKRGYRGVFSKLNDNILTTSCIAILLIVAYELFALILSALVYLAFQFGNAVLTYIFSVAFFLGMHFVLLYLITLGYLWLPCLQVTGFRAFEALTYSNQLCQSIKRKILVDQFMLLFISEVLISASLFIPADNVVPVVVATVLYVFMMVVFCVRMQIVYFDRAQIDRADLKSYYER